MLHASVSALMRSISQTLLGEVDRKTDRLLNLNLSVILY